MNRLNAVEPLSFERHFQFWEHSKFAGSYAGTVRWLAKLYNLVFRQKLMYKVRWMRWRLILMKKPVTAHTRVIPKILFKISQTVVFGIPRSFSSSRYAAVFKPLSVLCPYFSPQRPSVSFQSSLYNSCRDWSKTWCKFVDLFFLSFSTVNKCDERKKARWT